METIGVSPDKPAFRSFCHDLAPYNIDILALQETNLNTGIYSQRETVKTILQQEFGMVKLITACTPLRSQTAYKPGGVLLAAVGDCAHRVVATNADPLGRWCSMTITGKQHQLLQVYCIYQCVDQSHTSGIAGEKTYFSQQWEILHGMGVSKPQPRTRLIQDLQKELLNLPSDRRFILLGDFNETIGHDPNLMASICSRHHLVDAVTSRHPHACNTPTYSRGTKRLDYALLSPDLLPFLQASGLNQFNEVLTSDHRAIFLDFERSSLLRTGIPLVTSSQRIMHSDSASIKAFVQHAYEHLHSNKVFERIDRLPTPTEATQDTSGKPVADCLDRLITQALLAAERKVAKPPKPPWSEDLHLASATYRLWKTVLTSRLTKMDMTDAIEAARTKSQCFVPIPNSISEIRTLLRKALLHLRKIRLTASEHRQQFLEQLRLRIARRKHSNSKADDAAALKCLDAQLKSKKTFRKIQHTFQSKQTQPLTAVRITSQTMNGPIDPETGVPQPQTSTTTIDTKEELEKALLARNRQHFAQAEGTPFTRPPLSAANSDNGLPLASQLPPGTFSETTAVIDILREAANQQPMEWSEEVTFQQFLQGFRTWRESTSTSPSGRHLGLYKALLIAYYNESGEFAPKSTDDEAPNGNTTNESTGPTTQFMADKILIAIFSLADTATRNGYALERWTKVINVMIYKEPGNINLEKLRVIHLFEADFNLMVGILFGRRAMYHAIQQCLIHSGQGGRIGGECEDVALTKVLHISMSHLTRTSLGIFESDAASCFDRIIMRFAFHCFRALGSPLRPLAMWEHALYNICHSIKTGYGESSGTYQFSPDSPIHGPGQGSKGGVASICAISTILLRAIDTLGHGSSFSDPSQSTVYHGIAQMYFDDTTNYFNDFTRWLYCPPNRQEIALGLQKDAQHWERLLYTSGDDSPPRLVEPAVEADDEEEGRDTVDDLIVLTSGTEAIDQPIQQLSPKTTHRTLGVHISATFNTSTAIKKIHDKVTAYATRLATSGLSYRETRVAYFACFLPQVLYGIALMTHARKDLDRVQRLATSATLAKMGFRRTIHRSLAYGSPLYGGLGLREFYVEQGIAQLQLLIRHLRADSPQGRLLRISIDWAQLQAGVPWNIFSNPTKPLPHLPFTWLTSVRQFLAFAHCRLTITDSPRKPLPVPCRQRDQCIMDAVLMLLQCSPAQIERFNRVRLFLQVTWLSEIVTADGRYFSMEAWQATRQPHTSTLWPSQPEPSDDSVRLWQQLLNQAFLSNARTPRFAPATQASLLLTIPLGRWLPNSEWLQERWNFFYSSQTHLLYCAIPLVNSSLRRFTVHPHCRRSRQQNPKFEIEASSEQVSHLPAASIPVDVTELQDHLVFPSIARIHPPSVPTQRISAELSFEEYLQTCDDWDRQLLGNIQLQPSISWRQIVHLLENNKNTILLGSDGGAQPPIGSFGAVLATSDTILLEMGGIAHGDTPSSFRAESYGQLAPLRLLHHLQV